ncbi:putative disease resistance RPP13-like protein 1 [Carya illinoinensis]|uniref:putative disease resistance RPP13-like protein 1 n=1 Tax=Carya illinoinensis TaxID=32201 RepID=UPI001C720749|nr:putative disease resistance RPP13-like protein 1 [Carya illinoinensis]
MFGARNPSIGSSYLGQLLHYGTRGSTILVTTRNDSVALAMHAIATHRLDLLPENDCWSLFEKHAFRRGSSNANPKIKEIGTQIVEKYKGIPLAIKAIGDLLGSKSDHAERYWTTILKSNLWDVPMEKTNIIPALWLKGFLQQSEIETMEEVGNGYFNDLVSRSLFQQSSCLFKPGFVMHDLVNDLAKSVTGKFGFTMEFDSSKEIGEMTRYLLCFNVRSSGIEKIEKHLFKAKQLRTLLVINLSMGYLSSLNDYFKKNGEDLLVA